MEALDSGNKFMIGSVGSLRVYCLRGTRTPMDVVSDLTAVPKPLGPGEVHKGFYDRVDKVLTKYPVPPGTSRVVMTGH